MCSAKFRGNSRRFTTEKARVQIRLHLILGGCSRKTSLVARRRTKWHDWYTHCSDFEQTVKKSAGCALKNNPDPFSSDSYFSGFRTVSKLLNRLVFLRFSHMPLSLSLSLDAHRSSRKRAHTHTHTHTLSPSCCMPMHTLSLSHTTPLSLSLSLVCVFTRHFSWTSEH